ncbi:hypothetical protein PDESU_02959 [Pontiella desulfatans]|uniref:Uncharacterized protein n=1 Tax=Pontiella desulfatans TaxID=2750659 RepID=A0A6C2U316_PONDE|nr:hypothetical protein [Pontiella desulfatans]VGO14398.1 hypothetical protein PDESU_02959 [Pontiella desulfatans]
MKQIIILIIASFIISGCGKQPSSKEPESSTSSLEMKSEDIESITIFYFDSGDNTSPSKNDSKWVVTNQSDIAFINDIIQSSIPTLQSQRFGESMSWHLSMIGIKKKNQDKLIGIALEVLRDGLPIYCDVWSAQDQYFTIPQDSGKGVRPPKSSFLAKGSFDLCV